MNEENMTVRDATLIMFNRYKVINSDFEKLCNPTDSNISSLIDQGIKDIQVLPIDKLSRWLGFIQHYLISNGLCSVEGERDFSRPLFHAAYKTEGIDIPEKTTCK